MWARLLTWLVPLPLLLRRRVAWQLPRRRRPARRRGGVVRRHCCREGRRCEDLNHFGKYSQTLRFSWRSPTVCRRFLPFRLENNSNLTKLNWITGPLGTSPRYFLSWIVILLGLGYFVWRTIATSIQFMCHKHRYSISVKQFQYCCL